MRVGVLDSLRKLFNTPTLFQSNLYCSKGMDILGHIGHSLFFWISHTVVILILWRSEIRKARVIYNLGYSTRRINSLQN